MGGNLKAINVVGPHDGQDLRVRMLSKANVVVVVVVIILALDLTCLNLWSCIGCRRDSKVKRSTS